MSPFGLLPTALELLQIVAAELAVLQLASRAVSCCCIATLARHRGLSRFRFGKIRNSNPWFVEVEFVDAFEVAHRAEGNVRSCMHVCMGPGLVYRTGLYSVSCRRYSALLL